MKPRRPTALKSPAQRVVTSPVALTPGEQFNPYGLFTGIFIPEAICKYRGVSLGAKMVYGRLCRYAGRDGAVYPALSTLASELGIGKTQARTYVQELERKHFIAVDRKDRHFGPNGAGGSNRYVFLWHVAFDGDEGQLRKTPPIRKTGGVPLRKTGPLPLRKTGGEENHHQESQKKESQSKRRSASAQSGLVVASEGKQKTSLSDDDEKQRSAVPQYSSPWDELRAKFRVANRGAEMASQDEYWLKENMEQRSITPEALVKLVNENSLSSFHTPMAGLKWLVKKFRAKTHSSQELEDRAKLTSLILSPPAERPGCKTCGNTGRVLERIEGERPKATDQYCDCRMGKELEAVERRRSRAADAPDHAANP